MASTQIRADIFPANTTLIVGEETTIWGKSRVILTLDYAYVFADASPTPTLVFSSPLESYTPPPPTTRFNLGDAPSQRYAVAETSDGTLQFYKDPGCGCGMKLKSMRASDLLQIAIPDSTVASYAAKSDSV